jgi:hypothetical protein
MMSTFRLWHIFGSRVFLSYVDLVLLGLSVTGASWSKSTQQSFVRGNFMFGMFSSGIVIDDSYFSFLTLSSFAFVLVLVLCFNLSRPN